MNTTLDNVVSDEASLRPMLLTGSLIFVLVAFLAQTFWKRDALDGVPIVGKGGKSARRRLYQSGGAWDLYEEGYKKFKGGIFRLATPAKSESVVVAPKYMAELKKLPDDVLSFDAALYESTHSEYTMMDTNTPTIPRIVRGMLNPALVRLNPLISQEVMDAMTMELPQSGEWEEIDINTKMTRIIAIVSGRIFVGPELCRSERYIDMAINYTIEVMTAVYVIGLVPTWLRPLVAPYLLQVKQLTKRLKDADAILLPVVNARKEAEVKPDDLMQWIIDAETKAGSGVRDIARLQLSITMAAIHTTTLTTVNILYTLAARPDLIPELQEEIREALAGDNGEFGSSALQNMKKLDSLFKETARFYPMGAVAFQRKALKPFMLSNGQVIPAGVIVEVPAGCIYADDEFFERPEIFDHLRFYNLRQSKGLHAAGTKAAEVVANSQFVSVSESSLNFGYGRHACPGRFFAANEMKMIMANILLHYEVKNPDGVNERYKNVRSGSQLLPDPTKKIMIRKIK